MTQICSEADCSKPARIGAAKPATCWMHYQRDNRAEHDWPEDQVVAMFLAGEKETDIMRATGLTRHNNNTILIELGYKPQQYGSIAEAREAQKADRANGVVLG